MIKLHKIAKHNWNVFMTDDLFVDISKNVFGSKHRLKRFKECSLQLSTQKFCLP